MNMSKLQASFIVAGCLVSAGIVTTAPTGAYASEQESREVYLVRQDFSDCTDSNVPNVDSPNVVGTVGVVRQSDGKTALKIALTASPNTVYHFNLKCVGQLGDIKTSDEGIGIATFTFPTDTTGNVYAFDSYPEGAPAGNKFQSAQVKF